MYNKFETHCDDRACADCPGFLVPSAGGAHLPIFIQQPQIMSLNYHKVRRDYPINLSENIFVGSAKLIRS